LAKEGGTYKEENFAVHFFVFVFYEDFCMDFRDFKFNEFPDKPWVFWCLVVGD